MVQYCKWSFFCFVGLLDRSKNIFFRVKKMRKHWAVSLKDIQSVVKVLYSQGSSIMFFCFSPTKVVACKFFPFTASSLLKKIKKNTLLIFLVKLYSYITLLQGSKELRMKRSLVKHINRMPERRLYIGVIFSYSNMNKSITYCH